MQTQYYAGWDGGGTKTLCRVLYQDGTAPQPFTAGALNPNGTVAGQCEAAVADLLRRGREFASQTFDYFETYTVIALVYLIITLLLSKGVSMMEGRLTYYDRDRK